MFRMTNFGEKHVADILACGLTHCQLTSKADVEVIRDGVERLIALPPEERERWQCGEMHRGQPDLGLARRDRVGCHEEHKWFYHYNPRLLGVLRDTGVDVTGFTELLGASNTLYVKALALGDTLSTALGLQCRESDAKLRVVWYDAVDEPGKTVAHGHWDRNTATIHLAESHAGLMVPGVLPEAYVPEAPAMRLLTRAHDDLVHVFLGAKLTYINPQRFKPLWHSGVMPKPGERRWAMVFFYHHTMEEDKEVPEDWEAKNHEEMAKVIRAARRVAA